MTRYADILFIPLAMVSMLIFTLAPASAHPPVKDPMTAPAAQTPRILIPDLEQHHKGKKPWTSTKVLDAPSRFHFAIVSDRTGGHRAGVFSQVPQALNLLQPAFVLSVGDLIEGYTDDAASIRAEWDGIDDTIYPLEAPLFFTAGNHDISNSVQYDLWKERFGVDYYHFLYKDTLFLVINSEVFPEVTSTLGAFLGTVDNPEAVYQTQMAYVRRVLEQHKDVRWTFVFMHNPIWDALDDGQAPGWTEFNALIGNRPHTLFAGHQHHYNHRTDPHHGHKRITLSSTGGHSQLRGPNFGEFDHIAWVTMTEEEPVIAQIPLETIFSADMALDVLEPAARNLLDVVSVQPLIVRPGRFRRDNITIRLKNNSDKPIGIRGIFPASANLTATPGSYAGLLSPGEHRKVDITLTTRNRIDAEHIAAIEGVWTVSTQSPADPDKLLTVHDITPLIPEHDYEVTHNDSAIIVDGNLKDWGGIDALPYEGVSERSHGETHFGDTDLSVCFSLRLHEDTLYFAGFVKDDNVVVAKPTDDLTNQDYVQFRLDTRPDKERDRNLSTLDEFELLSSDSTLGFLTRFLLLNIAPFADDEDALKGDLGNRVWLPHWPGVEAKTMLADDGYIVEAAIPIDGRLTDPTRGDGAQVIRANVMVHDFDHAKDRTENFWRASRFLNAGHSRSGRFRIID